MFGQGRPFAVLTLCLVAAFGARPGNACAQAKEPSQAAVSASTARAEFACRLRIEWGGGEARPFDGELTVGGGTLSDPAPLGLEPDEPGSMYLEEGRLVIAPRGPRTYDGVDVTLHAHGQDELTLRLGSRAPDGGRQERTVRVRLKNVLQETVVAELEDFGGHRVSVRRTPGDRLQVRLDREHVVFAPGELLELAIRPHLLGYAPGTALRLSAALHPARQPKPLWSDTTDLTAPADDAAWATMPLSLRLPDTEGVYDVVLELARRDLSTRLRIAGAVERRKLQLVVLSPLPPGRTPHHTAPEPQVLEEIDPASPGWWERARSAALPQALRRGPLGNCRVQARRSTAGLFIELPPSVNAAGRPMVDDLSWQAYPLSVARPGAPHFLEVEVPSDVAQSLGISMFEPDASGALQAVGVDQGLHVDETDVRAPSRRVIRRFVVWPQTTTPLVVMMNRRHDAPAVYGKLRLLGPRAMLPAALPWQLGSPVSLPQAHLPEARAEGRSLFAYFDRPLFTEAFSHHTAFDVDGPEPTRPLDDWVTFHDGARRLVEYLTYAGYNGAIVTVAADGGAIYPSTLLEPSPRYDDGTHFHSAQDPLRKDVLELLLRMFDREGLRLVPVLDLSAPLPRLEAERRAAVAANRPDPVGPLRTTARTAEVAAPLYDPLRPRVAKEITAVVAELAERYGSHQALAGVGLQLSGDGYLQLPGLDYGADLASLRRFADDSGITLPSNLSEAESASHVLDAHRAAWLAWRAARLTETYAGWRSALGGESSQRRLYLLGAHSWDRRDAAARLRPTLPPVPTADQMLLEGGVDPARIVQVPGLVWMRPYHRVAPGESASAFATAQEINRSEACDAAARAQPEPAGLTFHVPREQRLASFETASPFQPVRTRIVASSTPAGAAARRTLVHQLAALDAVTVAQGGAPPALGHDDDLRRFAAVLRALPAEKFTTVAGTPSYVAVRTLTRADGTYLYVANDATWPITVTLDVEAADDCPWRGFGPNSAQAGWVGSEGSRPGQTGLRRWQAKLEPYDVVGGMFLTARISISNPQIAVDPEIAERLAAHVRRLWSGLTALQRSAREARVANPGFETDGDGVSWRLLGDDGGFTVTADAARSGRHGARLVAGDAGAVLAGESVTIDPIGRVALSAWLRATEGSTPTVRLALEGIPGGRRSTAYYRYATIGGDDETTALGPEWRQFVFPVHDLPTDGCDQVRIRLELTGSGTVEVDDVRLADLDFAEAERLQLSKLITLAEYKLQRGELGDCARLLDGPWSRFLAAQAPVDDATAGPLTARRPEPKRPVPAPAAPAEAPAMRDRLKKLLPEFLR